MNSQQLGQFENIPVLSYLRFSVTDILEDFRLQVSQINQKIESYVPNSRKRNCFFRSSSTLFVENDKRITVIITILSCHLKRNFSMDKNEYLYYDPALREQLRQVPFLRVFAFIISNLQSEDLEFFSSVKKSMERKVKIASQSTALVP